MYGLKQADIISYNQIIFHMEPHSYYTVTITTGLWTQNTRKKQLVCVDDFGVIFF